MVTTSVSLDGSVVGRVLQEIGSIIEVINGIAAQTNLWP